MYEEFFSKRLADLRTEKNVSAREMSLAIGQSENYINKIENKKTYPSMTLFFYICEYLGITPQDFFDDKKQFPAELNNLISDIEKLDKNTLQHFSALAKEIINKK